MGRQTIWALASVLILAACTDTVDDPTTTTLRVATTTTTTPAPTDPGRLAIVDSSGNVVVMDPDGSNFQELTDDGGESAGYLQPVWSPDGATLAWGRTNEAGFAVGIRAPGSEETTILETPNLPYYLSWSPNGDHLGILHDGGTGVEFQMVDVAGRSITSLDEDTPFYFSWSPSGDRVVTHAGGARVATITPNGDRVTLEPTAANYLSPHWTDTGVFHVVEDRLVLEDETGERNTIAAVSGFTMFVSNPQGTHVALQTTGDGAPITASTEELPTVVSDAVVVVDVETGDTEIVDDSLALGFFWSPDGRSLLVMTVLEGLVVPRVWDTDGGEQDFPGYQPSGSMLQRTFPFFPQYAQSHNFWAPDSSAFAYAGTVEGESGIWVQSRDEEAPTRVSDGSWVAWSPPRS